MYVTHSSLDIMFPVCLLSRFMHKPTSIHHGAAKHLLRYLAGAMIFGILYCKTNSTEVLQGFSDSDWGTNPIDRKGTSGMVFNLGSGAVTWMSKKQDIAALFSTEAEYIALSATCYQRVRLKQVLTDCGLKHEEPITINCDNKSCIPIAQNPVLHGKTKHVDVKFQRIKNLIAEEVVRLKYCSSKNQLVDIMTKCLD